MGENTYIYDVENERISFNNFNLFFQQPAHYADEPHIDDTEMKFIQQHYKIKVELSESSYFGYIFISKDYLEK